MIKALGKNVIVKQIPLEKKGTLFLPIEEKNHCYEVLSTGEDVFYIHEGEHVYIDCDLNKIPRMVDELFYVHFDKIYAKKEMKNFD